MFRIFRYMKGYGGSVALILVLLFAQAFCDLALPQYTSNMIDTGIQNKGVEWVIPEKISKDWYERLAIVMDDDEKKMWEESYEKEDESVYKRKELPEKELEKANEVFAMPFLVSVQLQMMQKEQGNADFSEQMFEKVRKEMEEKTDTMGDTLLQSSAIALTQEIEKMAGVDMEEKQTAYLWKSGLKMLLVALLMAGTSVFAGLLSSRVGAGIGRDLRRKIYEKVMRFSSTEMNQYSTASLITRSTNDIQQIQMVETMLLRMVLYAPIIGIGGIIKVLETKSGMEWIIVLAVVVLMVVIFSLLGLAMPKFKIMQKLIDRVNLVSREILTGLPVIRAFGREEKEEKRFEDANVSLMKNMLFTNRVMTFMMPCMMLIMNGVSVLIIWVSADKIDTGTIQVGTMTAFITYAMQIVMAFLMLTLLSVMMPRAIVASERIDEVLDTNETNTDAEDAKILKDCKGVIRFEKVDFAYSGGEENVLQNISFEAKPGQTTAVIGGTGCGKSTLINLIPRFYDVTKGCITIDGVDIRNYTQESLREIIGYVPQKAMLFSGTIETNLKYGKEDATIEQIEEAVQIAQAKEIIDGKADGYDSHIAQGGSNVSGGQKQRFSIARAIVKQPKIYIFDDSFSALDYKTDSALRNALAKKTKDATVFIVAQRISTILNAEQIIVLEEGKIAGVGTHKELMKTCEVYQEIAASQLSQRELEKLEQEGKEGEVHE